MTAASSTADRMRILLVGFVVPEATIQEAAAAGRLFEIAANKLQWNIVNGVEVASGGPMNLVSSLPVHDYPLSPRIVVHGARWCHREDSEDVMLPYLNVVVLKHLTRFVSCFYYTSAWLTRNRGMGKRMVLVYGSHSGHLAAALAAVRVLGGKIVNIVTDLPSSPPFQEGCFRNSMRTLDRKILRWGMRRMDGLIVLARRLAEDLAPAVPWLLMEGVVSASEIDRFGKEQVTTSQESTQEEFVILYSGGIHASYGVDLLISAFSLLENKNFRLWLFGKGTIVNRVEEAAQRDRRIKYWGVVPEGELQARAMQASVMINPRPGCDELTQYSFPSKLLSYMITGRPVISTRLAGIPAEYFQYLIPLEEETPNGLAELLQIVAGWEHEVLDSLGQRARQFVKTKKNHISQGRRIFEFLRGL